ncbi:MAG: bifunctional metallophosphatase/5'-nucleotidase [Methylophilus sp.]|nr:bifunctional metallophosphatase/5'-nucleotidase [Methylophilus sp.]
MKKNVMMLVIAAMLATSQIACAATTVAPQPFTVKIIGFNDYHGNLKSPGTFGVTANALSPKKPVGGADFMAGYVAKMKATNPNNIVVGAGDLIGASPLISALFHEEPAVETLNRIGLEFSAVGNHEFDKGASELQRLQNGGCHVDGAGCKGATVGTPYPFEGAKFKWLSANVINTATGKTFFPAYGIKTFNGVKVAFIGMTLKDTPTVVTPSGVAGLSFNDEAATVNALVPRLRAQGIESIVVLVHQGGFQNAGTTGNVGSDINGCDSNLVGSDIAKIVSQLDDAVDLVVSGHSHAAYNCSAGTVDTKLVSGALVSTPRPTGIPNKTGRLIPVTQASNYGRLLTDIDVTINPATRNITAVYANNILVDRSDASVTPSSTITGIVNTYESMVAPIANVVIGSITQAMPNSSNNACNSDNGQMIADAQLAATAPAQFGGAQIAFMNRGGVRADFTFPSSAAGEGNGNVTYGEAYTVQPFGNSLVTMTLTAQDLKNVLEQQFAGCRGQSATATRMMHISNGFKYDWDGSKTCDSRISNVSLNGNIIVDTSGNVLNPAETFRVTVNNFMATGGDGFTTFLNGTTLLGGAQDIDALSAYLANYNVTTGGAAYDPTASTLGKPRLTRIGAGTACPTGANTNL